VLEIGGTHVTAALVDLDNGVVLPGIDRGKLNPAGSARELLGAIIACGRGLSVPAGQCWGVAIPGPFDYERGIGLFANVGKFEALCGVDIRRALTVGLPGPPGSVIFLNDADAFLWGEWLFGAAAGHDRCAAITLGTGIGSAFIADGELRHDGPGVPPEGRVDLLRIAGLALEDVVSARAIEKAYHDRTGVVPDSTAYIAAQARRGDAVAAAVLRSSFEQLGTALRPWLEEFGASVLVIGGSMTGSWDLIGPALLHGFQSGGASALKGFTASVAARPEHAPLLGAAAYAERAEIAAGRRSGGRHPGRPPNETRLTG
jgi:glucokinase